MNKFIAAILFSFSISFFGCEHDNIEIHAPDGYNFTNVQSFTMADGLSSDYITCINAENKDTVWIGTKNGLSYFYRNKFYIDPFFQQDTVILAPNEIYYRKKEIKKIMRSKSRNIYVHNRASMETMIYRLNNTKWKILGGWKDGWMTPFETETFLVYEDNQYWACTPSDIYYYIQNAGAIEQMFYFRYRFPPYSDPNIVKKVNVVFQDNLGQVWIGTTDGLFCKRYDGVDAFSTKEGLLSNSVMTIYQTSDNKLWFGTDKGLMNYEDNKWSFLTSENGLIGDSVTAITEDTKKRLWIGTTSGLSRLDFQKTWKNYTLKDGLISNRITSIAADKSNYIWIGSDQGITVLRNE
jgi:ligand-binding sensor domain-containing protein